MCVNIVAFQIFYYLFDWIWGWHFPEHQYTCICIYIYISSNRAKQKSNLQIGEFWYPHSERVRICVCMNVCMSLFRCCLMIHDHFHGNTFLFSKYDVLVINRYIYTFCMHKVVLYVCGVYQFTDGVFELCSFILI